MQLQQLVRGDPVLSESAKAGIDSVIRFVALQRIVNQLSSGANPGEILAQGTNAGFQIVVQALEFDVWSVHSIFVCGALGKSTPLSRAVRIASS